MGSHTYLLAPLKGGSRPLTAQLPLGACCGVAAGVPEASQLLPRGAQAGPGLSREVPGAHVRDAWRQPSRSAPAPSPGTHSPFLRRRNGRVQVCSQRGHSPAGQAPWVSSGSAAVPLLVTLLLVTTKIQGSPSDKALK